MVNQSEALSEYDNPGVYFDLLFKEKKQELMLLELDLANCKSYISKAIINKELNKRKMEYAQLIKSDLSLSYMYKEKDNENKQPSQDGFVPFE